MVFTNSDFYDNISFVILAIQPVIMILVTTHLYRKLTIVTIHNPFTGRPTTLGINHVFGTGIVVLVLTFLFGTALGAFSPTTNVALASPATSSSTPRAATTTTTSGDHTVRNTDPTALKGVDPVGDVACAALVTQGTVSTYSVTGKLTRTATATPDGNVTTCTYAWSNGALVKLTIGTTSTKPAWEQYVLAFQAAMASNQNPVKVQINGSDEAFYASSAPQDGEHLFNRTYVALINGVLVKVLLVSPDKCALPQGTNIISGLSSLMLAPGW